VIFDNTQAFFANPIMCENIYNVYSPRKFFGVADGAYLICEKSIDLVKYMVDVSNQNAGYLFNAIEKGTNGAYGEYLANEERISGSGPLRMSKLIKHLLSGIDYLKIRERRRINFSIMNDAFEKVNCIGHIDATCEPMVYPLMVEHNADNIREKLIEKKIYVPQWWKCVIEDNESNEFERKLSKNLMPLPIDQRYMSDDIWNLVNIVMDIIRKFE
jgi:hypothetical protein